MSGGNPISKITNPISKAIGTDGSGGGALGALAKVDPGKAIGKGLSEVDKFVGREIPGGWKTVGITAAAIAAPYAYSALSASGAGAGAAGSAAAASEAGFTAAQASSMAAAGASEAAIAQNLVYAGVEAGIAADAASLAASGLAESAIAQNLAYAYNAAELGATTVPGITASGGSVIDYSTPVDLTPGGNTIPANSTMTPDQIAVYDLQQKVASQEALAKYGAGMTTGQKVMMGAQLGQGLLGKAMPQQQNPYQQQVARQQMPGGQVDYSGLLALLQPKSAKLQTSLLG